MLVGARVFVMGPVKPQKGIYYFNEGASGQLRARNLRQKDFKAAGFGRDCSFMLVETSGDELYFQAVSRKERRSIPGPSGERSTFSP
jgi:hypothetical protein